MLEEKKITLRGIFMGNNIRKSLQTLNWNWWNFLLSRTSFVVKRWVFFMFIKFLSSSYISK